MRNYKILARKKNRHCLKRTEKSLLPCYRATEAKYSMSNDNEKSLQKSRV